MLEIDTPSIVVNQYRMIQQIARWTRYGLPGFPGEDPIPSKWNVWQDISERPTGCATGDVVPKTMDALMAIVMGILTDVC